MAALIRIDLFWRMNRWYEFVAIALDSVLMVYSSSSKPANQQTITPHVTSSNCRTRQYQMQFVLFFNFCKLSIYIDVHVRVYVCMWDYMGDICCDCINFQVDDSYVVSRGVRLQRCEFAFDWRRLSCKIATNEAQITDRCAASPRRGFGDLFGCV